jgi:4-amino-4-deoxy-L-arabinose transferase-like glycosyltransferase
MRPGLAVQLRHQFWILLAASAVFFVGLGNARLWDEDETEYSRVAREMMLRGDWVVPTFNYQPWLEKPVFVYWLMIGSFYLFGVTEFAARFPSAVFAIGTALLAYHLGRRLFRPRVGLWAGLVLATTLNFVIIGRAATHDAALIFCTTASLLAYVLAMGATFWRGGAAWPPPLLDDGRAARFRALLPQSQWAFVAMYVPLGIAVMIKGPFGMLLPIASLGMFVWLCGSWISEVGSGMSEVGPGPRPPTSHFRSLFRRLISRFTALLADFPAAAWAMRPFTLAAVVLIIAAPWFVLAELRTNGGVSRVFFWQHNVQYILHPQQGHAGSSFYFYPLALIVGFFPWTIVLALGIASLGRRIWQRSGELRASALPLVWSATWFALMSFVGTKLPHYIVPTYPLLAVVAGVAIVEWTGGRVALSRTNWIGMGLILLIGLGLAVAFGLPPAFHRWLPGQPSYSWLGTILACGGLLSWLLQRAGARKVAVTSLVATAGAFYLGISAVAAAHFSREQSSVQMAEDVERFAPDAAPVAIYRAHLPGTLFYLDQRNPVVPLYSESRITAEKTPTNDCVGPNGEVFDVQRLFVERPHALLITDPQGLEELRPQLPADVTVLDRRPRFPKRGELVVIGRQLAADAAEGSTGIIPAAAAKSFRGIQR